MHSQKAEAPGMPGLATSLSDILTCFDMLNEGGLAECLSLELMESKVTDACCLQIAPDIPMELLPLSRRTSQPQKPSRQAQTC